MNALKEVSKVWLVAKMVYTLFESILGNKALEERLQRAAGKRHQKQKVNKKDVALPPKKSEPPKRKFDDLDISIPNGPPSHQVSYERSRPQTPAATPSLQPAQIATAGPPQISPQPPHRSKDGLLGPSIHGGNTRPTSPFNPSFSMPTTPPDVFLVTRNSPNLSQSIWENFQPDQLFPDGTNITGTGFSPSSNAVDPQLQMSQHHMANAGMGAQAMGLHPQAHLASRVPPGAHESPTMMQGMPGMGGMTHQQHLQPGMAMQTQPWMFDGNMHLDASSQDDNWSNSSRGQGPVVPPTLNVEDWYVAVPIVFP